MENIFWQDIRKVIVDFLQQRLANNSSYKSELTKLEKAKQAGDQRVVNESQQKVLEFSKRFDFENWMEDAATRRIFWISVCNTTSKGIHSSSLGNNINFFTIAKPNEQQYVSSLTPLTIKADCSGNAASLDIFSLLNQTVNNKTLLELIIDDHPAVLKALSDDEQKAAIYLANFKKVIFNDFEKPKADELNKQLYWPNSEESYLSQQENSYRLLVPLHPTSLCNVVYQKVQTRFSEENKKAREQRCLKGAGHQPYFTFHELAVVKLGGSNPQGVSQLISNQGGRNFLLPSMPPKFEQSRFPSINLNKENVFDHSLQYFCRFGFRLLFDIVDAPKNVIKRRGDRKDAFAVILTLLLKFARHIQTSMPAGWSRDYSLLMSQKLWLDPNRAELEDEENFKHQYEQGNWVVELEKDFAFWIKNALIEKFVNTKKQFSDAESQEWRREFREAVKASQRRKEGIF
ncbi:type I-F CRISPR-associated protein Csy1 [Gilliamella apis]|uniref:type I-F CRISPR-associated protein Csy1 n=1 Tax=Gilliamella apis TaxID=1970738 RepID=UPI000D785A68|nr:type I-F CRISPR-associated protein Csy1 [Gilliamella apis]PXY93583.1 type I-F CRISPR-associated protein Csy1 [Gilliamella apis]WLS95957.1 type I-F CRISPR-associated protein Csy1 [Gilliamella apis]